MLRVGPHFSFAMSVSLMQLSAAVVFSVVVVLYDAAVLLAAVAVSKQ